MDGGDSLSYVARKLFFSLNFESSATGSLWLCEALEKCACCDTAEVVLCFGLLIRMPSDQPVASLIPSSTGKMMIVLQ